MPRCGARLRLGARTGGRRATRATRHRDRPPGPAAGPRGRGRRETLALVLYSHLAASSMVRTQKSPPLRRSPSSSWRSRQAGTERGAGGVSRDLCNRCRAQIYLDATARRHAQTGCRAQALPLL